MERAILLLDSWLLGRTASSECDVGTRPLGSPAGRLFLYRGSLALGLNWLTIENFPYGESLFPRAVALLAFHRRENLNLLSGDAYPNTMIRGKNVMRPVAWAVAVSALFLSGCGDFDGWDQVRESVHYSHDLQPGGTLRIDNSNGRVDIAGWDRNSLDVSGEKYAGSPDLLKRIKVQIQVVGNDVTIHTVRPDGR